MNMRWILVVGMTMAFGLSTALAEPEGAGAAGGKEGQGRVRKERGERPAPAREMEMGERMLVEKMEEGALLERILSNPKIVEEIGLTEDQMTRIRTAVQDQQQQQTKLRTDMEQAALEQAKILTAANMDEEALLKAVEKTGALRTEMAKFRVRQLILIKKILTPEQLEKSRQMRQKFMERMKERRAEGAEGKGEARKALGEGGGGELLKEHRRKMEERRKNGNTVQQEKAGDEVDPQDPNH